MAVEKSPGLVPVMEQDRVSFAPGEAASEETLQRTVIAVGEVKTWTGSSMR